MIRDGSVLERLCSPVGGLDDLTSEVLQLRHKEREGDRERGAAGPPRRAGMGVRRSQLGGPAGLEGPRGLKETFASRVGGGEGQGLRKRRGQQGVSDVAGPPT